MVFVKSWISLFSPQCLSMQKLFHLKLKKFSLVCLDKCRFFKSSFFFFLVHDKFPMKFFSDGRLVESQ